MTTELHMYTHSLVHVPWQEQLATARKIVDRMALQLLLKRDKRIDFDHRYAPSNMSTRMTTLNQSPAFSTTDCSLRVVQDP